MSLAAIAFLAAAAAVAPGDRAPGFELAATDGTTVKLGDFAGRTVVLAFFPKAFTSG